MQHFLYLITMTFIYIAQHVSGSSRPSSGAQQLQYQPLVLPSEHCYHHAQKVKAEAATSVVELLMIGVRTPETC
jgi:hypothetical protein